MKIDQLIQERNKKLNEIGVLFVLLIIVALILDHFEPSLFTTIFSTIIKLASLYGLIMLARRLREPVACPCCNADISFNVYTKGNTKMCPFCKIRFDQDGAAYKRKMLEMKENHEIDIVVDASFFDQP